MKKILSVIFAACLAISLIACATACGETETASSNSDAPITFTYSIVKGDDTYYSLKSVTVSEKAQKLIAKKDYNSLAKLFNTSTDDYKAPATKYTKDTVTTIVIPVNYNGIAVKAISTEAISALTFVKKIVVGDNVEEISEGAFSSLTALEEIELPFVGAKANAKNEKKLFGYIFGTTSGDGLSACEQKYNDGDSDNTKTYYIPSSLKTVTVRGGNTKETETLKYKIEMKDGESKYIFEGDDGYDELNAIEERTAEVNADKYSVAPYAFYNCSPVETINLNGISEIEEYTFYGCTGIRTLSFNGEIKTIGEHAYENCTSLKAVNFNGVEKICEAAFKGCSKLGEDYIDKANPVIIPAALTYIGESAFENCTALKEIIFKGTGKTLGESAFKACTAIESVDLAAVTTFGDYAFYGCTNLATVKNYNGSISQTHIFDETEYVKNLA